MRSTIVGAALLVEFYDELPEVGPNARPAARNARRKALEKFHKQAAERYTEGTLLRLLQNEEARTRRAAILALGMIGTMACNRSVAARLRDSDRQVRLLGANTLWSIWFRADSAENSQELQRLLQLEDSGQMLAGLTALIKKAPRFAEAYNQRAIVWFRLEEYHKAVADCERALERNPFHFGAQSGMAQSFMKLRKPRQALRAFRNAYRLHPGLEGVEQTIRALEEALGEEGKR
jgi:tetratricopeptide (TPR) repeat protein